MGIHGNTWEYVGIRVFPGLFEASGNTWQTVWECPGVSGDVLLAIYTEANCSLVEIFGHFRKNFPKISIGFLTSSSHPGHPSTLHHPMSGVLHSMRLTLEDIEGMKSINSFLSQ